MFGFHTRFTCYRRRGLHLLQTGGRRDVGAQARARIGRATAGNAHLLRVHRAGLNDLLILKSALIGVPRDVRGLRFDHRAVLIALRGFHHRTLARCIALRARWFHKPVGRRVMLFALAGFHHVAHAVIAGVDHCGFLHRPHHRVAFFSLGGFHHRAQHVVAALLHLSFIHGTVRSDFLFRVNRFSFNAISRGLTLIVKGLVHHAVGLWRGAQRRTNRNNRCAP